MKFDCAILNPPYDRNLHLKILEKVIPMAEKVVNISPVRWLQDPFAPYNTRSDYSKFEDSISKKIESINVIPAKDASKLFDASFTMNLGIYVCGQGGYNYQHNDPLVTKIVEKTMEHSWMPFNWKNYYNNNIQQRAYVLNVAGIHSASSKYPIMCQTLETQLTVEPLSRSSAFTGGNGIQGGHFEFDTEEERKNFYNCYNHPFMQWHCSLWQTDGHIMAVKVPYFDDYSHLWDYKDFFTWFELTEEEQERIMREIAKMRGKSNQSAKTKFRATKKWKEFRDYMRKKQIIDPVTGQKLTRMANLHHCDLDEANYEDLSNENNFVFLNQMTHKCVHFLFSKSKPKQWRERIERLIPILEKMEKLNEV